VVEKRERAGSDHHTKRAAENRNDGQNFIRQEKTTGVNPWMKAYREAGLRNK